MRRNYERLAWMVLLLAFTICVGLAIFVPWTIQQYLRFSYTGELTTLVAQEGNLLLVCPGSDVSVSIKERQENLCEGREGAQISSGSNDKGLLSFHPRTTVTTTLATVQLYPGTRIRLEQARAPRFPSLNREPHHLVIRMESGRVRVSLPPQLARTVQLQIYTPQARVQLTDGSTSVEVNGQESQFSVREGRATVVALANNTSVTLDAEQRTVVPTGKGVAEPMQAPRNLIADGDFRQLLGSVWKSYTVDPQNPDESRGTAGNAFVENRPVVDLLRVGVGHAETGIVQEINRDIRDFQSLQLRVVLRVLQQDVPVCGMLGSECPVTVRIEYVDEEGSTRSWQQGFYYLPDPNVPANPMFCVTCNPRNPHIHTANGEWYTFDSPNLMSIFAQLGSAPVTLKSVSISASGHTYQSQIAEIELLGQE